MQHSTPSQRLMRSRPVRLAQLTLGVILMTFGPLIGWPLPGPFGFLSFGLGLALVLRNSRWARRRYTVLKRRYPKAGSWTDWALRRKVKSRKPEEQAHELADAG